MNRETFDKLNDYLLDIDSLINVTYDSYEQNMYTSQLGVLKIAKSYFNKVFELLSKLY